ncbi:pirin family protein [Flavobacteriales bacterium]|nr:pirin family protein [Flavobacteriales bacterium]
MSKDNSRRNFLQKVAVAASGAFIASKASIAANSIDNMSKPVVKNVKPLGFQWETMDPFLFCVHHEDFFPKGNEKMGPVDSLDGRHLGSDFVVKDGYRMYHGKTVPGFPGHPHRGFETVTVVRKGMVDHTDSLGGAGRYGDGDVQWMTAGKGVQHAEMFPLLKSEETNPMELFQIWLNLPRADKFVTPNYKMLWGNTIPTYRYEDSAGKKTTAEVIAGALGDKTAPSPTPNSWANTKSNEVGIWNIQMEAGATWKVPQASQGINRKIYFFKGKELKINETSMAEYHAAEVIADSETLLTNGDTPGALLILQGKPISEPVVQHGPFVMNTREEIQQAFHDYQQTGFGGWPWDRNDPVHDRSKKRFAKYTDGSEEIPD